LRYERLNGKTPWDRKSHKTPEIEILHEHDTRERGKRGTEYAAPYNSQIDEQPETDGTRIRLTHD
jgi:hypothetical protein